MNQLYIKNESLFTKLYRNCFILLVFFENLPELGIFSVFVSLTVMVTCFPGVGDRPRTLQHNRNILIKDYPLRS